MSHLELHFPAYDEILKHLQDADATHIALTEAIGKLTLEVNALRKDVETLETTLYKAGDDDIGGKLYKDIKDIDLVAPQGKWNVNLYNEAKQHEADIRTHRSDYMEQLEKVINGIVGDFTIREGLSDKAYIHLSSRLRLLKENLDMWEYL